MNPLTLALFGGLGLLLGLAHFRGLLRDTQGYLARGVRTGTVAVHALRLLATTAVLVLVARRGAAPLLATLAGFVAARFLAVSRARALP